MSWGFKIACLYTGFALLIATMVILTIGENTDLVTPDYYEQELKFQDRIDAIDRTGVLQEPLIWKLEQRRLYLNFPHETSGKEISGTVYFFRPSDAKLDKNVTIPETSDSTTSISTSTLQPGMYKMQISWQANSATYFNEGVIQIH
jgi:hypothetical protein